MMLVKLSFDVAGSVDPSGLDGGLRKIAEVTEHLGYILRGGLLGVKGGVTAVRVEVPALEHVATFKAGEAAAEMNTPATPGGNRRREGGAAKED